MTIYDICEYCGELIPLKECRATPRANTVWFSPEDQSHVYAECIPLEDRPTNVLKREDHEIIDDAAQTS